MRVFTVFSLFMLTISFNLQAAEIKELVEKITEEITSYEVQNSVACILVDNSINGTLTPTEGILDKHGVTLKYFCKEAGLQDAKITQVVMNLSDPKIKLFANRPIENYELKTSVKKLNRQH